ncbi:MAG: hypothetical protein J6V54_07210 [Bacteroidales bacterium]|nr:hypothetical protein [Bacteroidales bacterium]
MKNKDFDKQWNNCKEEYKKAKCPLDSNDLDRFITRAMETTQNPATKPKTRNVWIWSLSAAAACMAMLFVVNTVVAKPADEFQHIIIDGQEIIFACNNGCSPENTVEMFNQIIQ